jgi:uncharacterized protein YqfA (UPF0365 family)
VLGKLMVDIGNRTLSIDNCQKADVKVMADLANKLLKEKEDHSRHFAQAQAAAVSPSDLVTSKIEALGRLAELKASGVLSDAEFDTAKSKILASF